MSAEKQCPIRCIECKCCTTAARQHQTAEELEQQAPGWLLVNLVHTRAGIDVGQVVAFCSNCKSNANCRG